MPVFASMSEDRSNSIAFWLTTRKPYKDFPSFAERFLRVPNRPETSGSGKLGEVVPFRLNAVQRDLYERIDAKRRAGLPPRFIILKARREGISTLVQGYMMHRCLTERGRRAFIVALDRTTTNNIVMMAKMMHANLPSLPTKIKQADWRICVKENPECDLRPQTRRSNDNELWFAHPADETKGLNSRFQVVLADSVDSTRGFECHLAHLSEIAFYEDPGAFMLPMMQTVSDDPETLVVLESTANGAAGYFYNEFWRHWRGPGGPDIEKAPQGLEGDWESVFYAWHAMPDYRRRLPDGLSPAAFLDAIPDELIEMVEEYNLDVEQAYWAYRIWSDKCQSDWDLFRQEYPGKPEEAFAHAARRVFPERDLAIVEARADLRHPIFAGNIVDVGEELGDQFRMPSYSAMRPELVGDKDGPLWVFEYPVKGRKYLAFCDPCTGAQTGDNAGIQVIDMETRKQAAEYARHVSPIESARVLCLLGLLYGEALLAWEINGPGHAVSHAVMESGYWNLYVRQQVESVTDEHRFGWATNVSTKPMMVAVGIDIVTRHLPIIRSSRLLREMRGFLEFAKEATNTGGIVAGDENYRRIRTGAPPGEKDDLVMSWLGAQVVCDLESGARAWEAQAPPQEYPDSVRGQPEPVFWRPDGGTETVAQGLREERPAMGARWL